MTEALLKGLALGILLALSVGPVIFTVIKQSINNGYKGGLAFVAGVWISDIVWVVLSNAFSEMATQLLTYKKAIGYGGSAFLIGLGIFYVFFKKINLTSETAEVKISKKGYAAIVVAGFLINTLNPSVILFWIANATVLAVKHSYEERVVIFSVCLLFNIMADILKVVGAGKLRQRLTHRNISIINKLSGTILIGFGMALLWGILAFSDKIQ
jgi:threonine/homoserine/homoserine lactone efflux protein